MTPQTGLILRMLGPLIQLTCAAILLKTWGEGRTVAGVKLDSLLMLGFFVGLVLVVAGISLSRRPRRKAKSSALDLDLDRDRT